MTAQASHNDIMREIGALSQQAENLEVRGDDHHTRLGDIERKVDENARAAAAVLEALVHIKEDIAAIKSKVLAWEIMKARIVAGATVAATTIGGGLAFLWWLIGERIALFIKGPTP